MRKLFLSAVLICTAIFTANAQSAGTLIDMADASPPASGTGWTFAGSVYTIQTGATVTITGTNANQRRIEVAANATNVNITLQNVTIGGLGNEQSPLLLNNAAVVTLTLVGTNTLTARIGGGIQAPQGTTLTISGTGSLVANGTSGGAGIGGGNGGSGGAITINGGIITATGITGIGGGTNGSGGIITINGGTVTANGSWIGAGIGGAGNGSGGIITINGGVVTATGTQGGHGIGSGGTSTDAGTLTMNGNAVVFANSVGDTDLSRRTSGIVFIGNSGVFHGTNIFITDNVTIPNGAVLLVPYGAALGIPQDVTLTNNGMVINCGTILEGGTFGAWEGNPPVVGADDNTIDLSVENPVLPCTECWTFANNIYIIQDDATVTITGTSANQRRIEVASTARNVNITLEDVSIGAAWDLGNAITPLTLNSGAEATITLVGANTLVAGQNRPGIWVPQGSRLMIEGTDSLNVVGRAAAAGIGGAPGQTSGTIIINDGVITTTSTAEAAGIGGGNGGSADTIIINGGIIMATSGNGNGAGIGGGQNGSGGTIIINGGVVTATSGTGSDAQGIGRGGGSGDAGTLTMNGNAVVFANRISDTDESRRKSGILFIGNNGTLHGDNVAINADIIIPANHILIIPNKSTLTIPYGITLTNNGTVISCGTINNQGTWIGEDPFVDDNTNTIDLSAVLSFSCDGSWTFANGIYTIFDGANVTITGTSAGQRRIEVAADATVDITLEDVTIAGLGNWQSPLLIHSGAEVVLTLVGENTLTAGANGAGIAVSEGTVTIDGTGSLIATGVNNGAGIGGWSGASGGTIIINGGTVTATAIYSGSNRGGAGIGGGRGGSGGIITINGGTVTATGSRDGAGIGSGYNGAGNTIITINGGTVTAAGVRDGAGIGGGRNRGSDDTITINGGIVTALGGYWHGGGAGIGGGHSGGGGTIIINGGAVTATTGGSAQGIGRGTGSGEVGTLTMDNVIVFANSVGDTNEDRRTNGILVVGNTTQWYDIDEFTLSYDVVVPGGFTLTIDTNKTLIIPESITLINSGTIRDNWGTIDIIGDFSGNRIQFNNIGGGRDTISIGMGTSIDLTNTRLFNIHPRAGAPTYTMATVAHWLNPGIGTIDGSSLSVTQAGRFDIELVTAETEHYVAGARVVSTLIVMDPTSIVDFETQNVLNVHPNPFTDEIHIAGAEIGSTLYVLNAGGLVVHSQRITNETETIRLSHLPQGVYILRIGEQTVRVVKQ